MTRISTEHCFPGTTQKYQPTGTRNLKNQECGRILNQNMLWGLDHEDDDDQNGKMNSLL
jgi:hypothetical protein